MGNNIKNDINNILIDLNRADICDQIEYTSFGGRMYYYDGDTKVAMEYAIRAIRDLRRDFVIPILIPAITSGRFVSISEFDHGGTQIGWTRLSCAISDEPTIKWKMAKLQEALDI